MDCLNDVFLILSHPSPGFGDDNAPVKDRHFLTEGCAGSSGFET